MTGVKKKPIWVSPVFIERKCFLFLISLSQIVREIGTGFLRILNHSQSCCPLGGSKSGIGRQLVYVARQKNNKWKPSGRAEVSSEEINDLFIP
jgi:hypothetical protein